MLWSLLLAIPAVLSQLPHHNQNSRKAKASEIFKKTQNIEAVRRLLGHASTASTSRLGVENEDAMELPLGIRI